MKTLVRSLAFGLGLLGVGFVAGINVGVARGDRPPVQVVQASPSTPGATPDKPSSRHGIDMDVIEKVVARAAKAAFDKAAAEALDRIQKAALPPEVTALRQKIGELDKLRTEVKTELSQARDTALGYVLWGLAGFFGLMVLASVLGGAIVAAMFRSRRRA